MSTIIIRKTFCEEYLKHESMKRNSKAMIRTVNRYESLEEEESSVTT